MWWHAVAHLNLNLKKCATTWPLIHRLMKMAPPRLLLMPLLPLLLPLLPLVVVAVRRQAQFRTVSAGPTAWFVGGRHRLRCRWCDDESHRMRPGILPKGECGKQTSSRKGEQHPSDQCSMIIGFSKPCKK